MIIRNWLLYDYVELATLPNFDEDFLFTFKYYRLKIIFHFLTQIFKYRITLCFIILAYTADCETPTSNQSDDGLAMYLIFSWNDDNVHCRTQMLDNL